jgi:sortase A
LFGLGVGLALHSAWIPIKAEIAQVLLKRAWERTREGESAARPWSWADTWPVARLRFAEHDRDLIVLAGASGRTLAFAPGHLDGTALPGSAGNAVVSGHRDTHFAFLQYVLPGEQLEVETPDGATRAYRVTARHILYADQISVLDDTDLDTLTLITCYPFDSIVPGGPLRYVVRAERLDDRERPGANQPLDAGSTDPV